ncbi:hypothetical protein ACTOB_005976 [Actinoplanes oblitus]|uniref:Uncharacterized protein n=1 Tax=Actinoplanes oblitus TaxID=3040509 RepID=A0ABY8WA55_9ACTN|nr:hypothetical protein [Actinoplanes oblitus]WIM93978.1 hypothetical protein ACTOB_005976 [Actinoplanes oblitus]
MSDRDEGFAEYFAARAKLYLRWHRVSRQESLDPYLRQVLIRAFVDEGRWGWWRRERPSDAPIERSAPRSWVW